MGLSPEELSAQMAELQRLLEAQSQGFEEDQAELKALRDEENTMIAQFRAAQHRRMAREKELSQKKSALAEYKDRMKALSHELTRSQVEEATKKRERELAKEYESIIAGAKWREFLYDHQMFGAKFGANAKRWICGDTVGLGKTVQAVAWLDLVKAKKVLVLTPKNLTQNFIDHIQEWSNGRNIIAVVGMDRSKRDLMLPVFRQHMQEYVVVVNYEAWFQDRSLLDLLVHMQFDTIVCDEAHKLKNLRSASFLGVEKLTYLPNFCLACSHYELEKFKSLDDMRMVRCLECGSEFRAFEEGIYSVKNILEMTGTGIKNKPQDLFPLLHLVNRHAFPNEKSFLSRYCSQTYTGRWTWATGGEAALTKEMGPFYLKRTRADAGIKIPPQKTIRHDLFLDPELYPEQFQAYKTLRELSKVVIDNTEENESQAMAANAMITYLLRLRQMMSLPSGIVYKHPKTKQVLFECQVKESIKVDKAVNLIEEFVEDGARVLVFTRFAPPIHELSYRLEQFSGIRVCTLDGSTPVEKRKAVARNFDAKYVNDDGGPKWDVALCNYGVGSEGLTLTDATDTILLDLPWSPAEREQATGRTNRIGQQQETRVHELITNTWIDKWMLELNELKQNITDGFEESLEFVQIARDALMSDGF